MQDLRDQIQRRAVRGQTGGRAQSAKIPVTVVPSGGRIHLDRSGSSSSGRAFDSGVARAGDPHFSRHRAAYGDWKIDPTPIIGLPTDERRLRELGDAGVLALVGDSTNAVRDGRSPSETEVAATITKLVMAAKGRVAVTTFASNVARLKAVADAAKAAGREVVVVGRAMERVVQVARETGHLDACKISAAPTSTAISRRTRCWRCAREARASRARRWRASPMTTIRR